MFETGERFERENWRIKTQRMSSNINAPIRYIYCIFYNMLILRLAENCRFLTRGTDKVAMLITSANLNELLQHGLVFWSSLNP